MVAACGAYGISERRACMILGANRASVRYSARRGDDGPLRARLRVLAAERRRFGYRRKRRGGGSAGCRCDARLAWTPKFFRRRPVRALVRVGVRALAPAGRRSSPAPNHGDLGRSSRGGRSWPRAWVRTRRRRRWCANTRSAQGSSTLGVNSFSAHRRHWSGEARRGLHRSNSMWLPAPAEPSPSDQPRLEPLIPARPDGLIEVVTPGGVLVRVDGHVDERALRRVLAALNVR